MILLNLEIISLRERETLFVLFVKVARVYVLLMGDILCLFGL